MYRTKKDIDAHVESLISKLPLKEFTSRGYSIGRLYYEVGDYANCCKHVDQYLAVHSANAAAHALLGQALQKLGKPKKALEEFKTSYELCPTQNSLVLNICEILANVEENIDSGRAKYWCEKAEKIFPKHPVTFQLRERLLSIANPDPQALVNLLKEELTVRPKDVLLHIRLLKFYLKNNNVEEAFTHSYNIEFRENNFNNNFEWYETIAQILKCNPRSTNDWIFQLLLLTVTERMCVLSLTQAPGNEDKSIFESTELLHVYDQAIERVAKAGVNAGHGEFFTGLLKHHRSQFSFIAATLLLKRGVSHSWRDAARDAEPLMLMAWHSSVADPSASWVISAPETQQKAVRRWYSDGSYRCSQSGHYLLSNLNDKSQSFLDRISQNCSGTHWRDKLYGKIFSSRYHLEKINTSHLVSNSFDAPALMLPKRSEVEAYDEEAQRAYGNSLHHFVWLLLQYKTFSLFKCTTFDMLPLGVQNDANYGPESLCQLDVYAFLYCSTLTCRQLSQDKVTPSDKPKTLPANITDSLCSFSHMKWWDCAYKFSQNELGSEMTDIRATLSRGIEVVRCIDNHGLDIELLCDLGRIFSSRAKIIADTEDKQTWEMRAVLYYTSAKNLIEKKKNDTVTKSDQHMFEKPPSLSPKETNSLLEECKLYLALYELNNDEYAKVIELLSSLKSAQALYHLSVTYKKMALNENKYSQNSTNDETNSKYLTLLSTAHKYAYEAHYKLKDPENKSNHMLLMETEELINELDVHLNELASPIEKQVKNSSDEYFSIHDNEDMPIKKQSLFLRNFSSTPKRLSHFSMGPASNPNVNEQQFIGQIDDPKSMAIRDTAMNDFIDLAKSVFEENRLLGNQIMNTINSNMQNTTDQFALLKISVDQIKYQIDECRKECKEVGELKKQIAELKKDISKIKKASEQTINENELFNLDEGYTANDTTSTFAAQLPFTAQQVMPPFNQRLIPPFTVPPNPFQLYGQNLFNLYSQFSQPSSVPGAPSIFDAVRPQVNYPGVFSTPDQMYLDVAQLVQQNIPTAPSVPGVPVPAPVPTSVVAPTLVPPSTAPITSTLMTQNAKAKEIPRSLPANVVITSSDPMPTCTTAPAPVHSVTVSPKHIKGIPHNYQIQMPATEPTPIFGFPSFENKISSSAVTSNWTQNAVFKEVTPSTNPNPAAISISFSPKLANTSVNEEVSAGAANDSHNKSRTLSEKSNTSIDNYDPCPDFKPIIPLPAEVKVTTGEENEIAIFTARAKLYRFVDNQWKERGLGEMKLLKHKITGKVRVLMRREQIHKICANHAITSCMEIKPMKNETKAYIWVANDFADETLVLEKFCVRFKTADIARQFYETFEKASSEATVTSVDSEVPINLSSSKSDKTGEKSEIPKTIDIKSTSASNLPPAKTVFGGFTFSSTPAFKTVDETKLPGINVENIPTSKVNVFSGLNFKTGLASSPFNNLFNTSNSQTNSSKVPEQNTNLSDKLNASDTVEEYEPTGEFTPVVPLPALVDTKTGEEGEIVLFEYRAKLLRFVDKEWKERGLGNIKLLINKENKQKLRLLMRREQVMKVCCNHAVTKTMTFQKMPNVEKAVTWCAQDFSEGELTPETFCLRFKTVQACNDFIDVVKSAQSKLKDEPRVASEVWNASKQIPQRGATTVNKPANSNWGDKFKPKQGSWECKECLVRNEANIEICPACNSPKNTGSSASSVKTTEAKLMPSNESKFKFGISQQSNPVHIVEQEATTVNKPANSNWGDKFKPKQGSWECKECLVRNEGNIEMCPACNSPKNPGSATSNVKTTEAKLTPSNEMKFKFGISQQSKPVQVTEKEVTNAPIKSAWGDIFKPSAGSWECKECFVRNESGVDTCCACNSPKDPSAVNKIGTANTMWSTSKFKFGIPAAPNTNEQKTETTSIFDGTGAHKFNFGIAPNAQVKSTDVLPKNDKMSPATASTLATGKLSDVSTERIPAKVEHKPALLPTPQKQQEAASFDFVFKPKTQQKAKSPVKSPKNDNGDESDGNEYASEDEGHHIHITPIVPLPDKVKVVTGEEDEDELFGHRAKLLIFVSGEWKERGLGIVKILKHKQTSKLRVVMRREQVFKICLNHALTPDVTYNLKDEKNWIFAANDFSEGELSLQSFCLKFKTKEIAMQFKCAVDKARDGNSNQTQQNQTVAGKVESDNNDVEFISETQSNSEEKKKALELMLPENFFLYKNKEACPGCRGCEDSKDLKPSAPKANIVLSAFTAPTSFSSPQQIPSNNDSVNLTPGKIMQKPKLVPANSTSSLFRAPMLSSSTIPGSQATTTCGSVQSDPKSIFASANSNLSSNSSIFGSNPNNNGNSEVKSIFGTVVNSKLNDNQKPDAKSFFGFTGGVTNQKPFNLFNQNEGSIFGNTNKSLNPNQTSTFTSSNVPHEFGNGKSIWTFDPKTDTKPPEENKSELVKLLNANKEDTLTTNIASKVLGADSFASFSVIKSQPELKFQRNPDFQWEGAGQQLFAQTSKPKNIGDGDSEIDTGNGGDEEYDPHYEPIVPLPDKITVRTGEEDEEKLFGMRCKLFRYSETAREWKERGVGELKILHHPTRNTYRLLFRREQVHKAVLNMLLFTELELLPMSKSDRAWTWAGRNYAENAAGDQETLAVRFKTLETATEFFEKVKECVRKLQAAAAQAIREEKEADEKPKNLALLRLPKHLQDSSRVENVSVIKTDGYSFEAHTVESKGQLKMASAEREVPKRVLFQEAGQQQEASNEDAENYAIREEKEADEKPKSLALLRLPKHLQDSSRVENVSVMKTDGYSFEAHTVESKGQLKMASAEREVPKRVLFQEAEQQQEASDEDAENYEHEQLYYQGDADDYDTYYNEEDESAAYFSCDCEAEVVQGSSATACAQAHVQVLFDHATYTPKIQLTNVATGELLADMLVHDETEFQLLEATCSWTGTDYTNNDPLETTITVTFPDSETAMQFYDSCESSKEHNSAADADTEA